VPLRSSGSSGRRLDALRHPHAQLAIRIADVDCVFAAFIRSVSIAEYSSSIHCSIASSPRGPRQSTSRPLNTLYNSLSWRRMIFFTGLFAALVVEAATAVAVPFITRVTVQCVRSTEKRGVCVSRVTAAAESDTTMFGARVSFTLTLPFMFDVLLLLLLVLLPLLLVTALQVRIGERRRRPDTSASFPFTYSNREAAAAAAVFNAFPPFRDCIPETLLGASA
jgi:hypothetical protein